MSETLLPSDERPRTQRRPSGTSFAGLVGVELRRLWWRRLTKVAVVALVLFTGAAVYNAYSSSTPERLAQQLDDYKALVADTKRQQADFKEQLPQMLAQCRQDQAAERQRSGDQSVDFGCDSIAGPTEPTLEQFGLVPPVADVITAGIATSAAYLVAFLAFVLGASAIGAEFTTGSMGNWLTFQPRRTRVALTKLAAVALGGAALAVVFALLTNLGARMIAVVNRPGEELVLPEPATATDSVPQLLLRVGAVAVLAGICGAALALVLRYTAGVVGVLLAYAVGVELIAAQAFLQGRLKPWTVGTNVEAFLGKGTTYFAERCEGSTCSFASQSLSYTHSWIFLLVVGLALTVVGVLTFHRRDVS
ncbi:ABC transporter permease subunit [Terrabacter sp. 2RAF25]|uniref:ABC transporter permease subunit n=1 Tax=Terrabacter sp. 2RAF25 TaxID=3232998 RepID=UPI003F9A13EF